MKAHGSLLFHGVVYQPKKDDNHQYYADKTFEEYSMRQYCWLKNKRQYIYTLSRGSWIGLLKTPWMCTIQVHPSSKLQVE
jgi:hypothetical protein